jgi:hypothetical protein
VPRPACIGYVMLSPLAVSVADMLTMKEQYRGPTAEAGAQPDGTAASDRRLQLEVITV